MKYKFWTQDEKDKLINLYMDKCLPPLEISKILGRTKAGILKQIRNLKLKHSKEQKFKCRSLSSTGKKNGMYNKTTWITGKTAKNNDILKIGGKKISKIRKQQFKDGILNVSSKNNGMYGKKSWNNGLTKETDIRIKNYGKKVSKTKKQQWLLLPEDEKEKIRIQWGSEGIKNFKYQSLKETSIEKIIRDFLESNNITHRTQYHIGRFIADFYIPNINTIIECNGDFWHANPKLYDSNNLHKIQIKNTERDKRKDIFVKSKGMDLIILWEYDINNNLNEIKEKLNEILQLS